MLTRQHCANWQVHHYEAHAISILAVKIVWPHQFCWRWNMTQSQVDMCKPNGTGLAFSCWDKTLVVPIKQWQWLKIIIYCSYDCSLYKRNEYIMCTIIYKKYQIKKHWQIDKHIHYITKNRNLLYILWGAVKICSNCLVWNWEGIVLLCFSGKPFSTPPK